VNVTYVYQLSNNGCTGSAYNVVVTVNPSPVARTRNITATLDANGAVTITPQQVDNGSVGYCGSLQYSIDKSSFTCANIGANTVTLAVTDAAGNRSTGTATVTVADLTGPVISGASASPNVITNATSKMVNVVINYAASDNCGSVTTTLSVRSNEAQSGLFKRDRSPDWTILSNNMVQLRAELDPAGSGRIYTITITSTDARGNRSIREVQVSVPTSALSNLIAGNKDLMEELIGTEEQPLRVTVLPNPSSSYFTVMPTSGSKQPMTMRILDAGGRMIETKTGVQANGSLQIGHLYRPGTYVIETIQGKQRVFSRIIKTAP
jgi:hypothetical protein